MRGFVLSLELGVAAAIVTVAMPLTIGVMFLSAVAAGIGAGLPVGAIVGVMTYENREHSGTGVESG